MVDNIINKPGIFRVTTCIRFLKNISSWGEVSSVATSSKLLGVSGGIFPQIAKQLSSISEHNNIQGARPKEGTTFLPKDRNLFAIDSVTSVGRGGELGRIAEAVC